VASVLRCCLWVFGMPAVFVAAGAVAVALQAEYPAGLWPKLACSLLLLLVCQSMHLCTGPCLLYCVLTTSRGWGVLSRILQLLSESCLSQFCGHHFPRLSVVASWGEGRSEAPLRGQVVLICGGCTASVLCRMVYVLPLCPTSLRVSP
jgi:hypothetical protein